jgi:nucleoside-diphosphate-sugar epimerase
MLHRIPAIDKIRDAIGWAPERTLARVLEDVLADVRDVAEVAGSA